MSTDYDNDFYAWTKEQAETLRRRGNALDWENLAEEIESMGKSERREIRSRLEIVLIHLLKWRYQPDHQSQSWRSSINQARHYIDLTIEDSPSLKDYPGEVLADAYRYALNDRAMEYLDTHHLPPTCEWTIEQVMDPKFWP